MRNLLIILFITSVLIFVFNEKKVISFSLIPSLCSPFLVVLYLYCLYVANNAPSI